MFALFEWFTFSLIQVFETGQLLANNCKDKLCVQSVRLPNLLVATSHATALIIGRLLYVCGGVCPDVVMARLVDMYDLDGEVWSTLPPAPQFNSEAVVIKNQLVLLGGRDASSGRITNLVSSWTGHDWQQNLPLMPTKRFRPGVTMFGTYVIVAGGRAEDNQTLMSSFIVLNTTTHQWFTLANLQLPWPMYGMKITICSNNVYIASSHIGYNATTDSHTTTKSAWQLPMCALEAALAKDNERPSRRWAEIASTPNYGSAFLQGTTHLVAIGGYDDFGKPTADISVFDPRCNKWSLVGYILAPAIRCTAVSCDRSSFYVLGGRSHPVDAGTLLNSAELVFMP